VRSQTGLWCLGFFIVVAVTNRYVDPASDYELYRSGMSDSFSYLALAEAAPGLPKTAMPAHHAQRIALPYVVGLVHEIVPIPLHALFLVAVGMASVAALLVLGWTLESLRAPPGLIAVMLAMFAFNPWAIRMFLAYPELLNDVGFMLGLSLVLAGLVRARVGVVLMGQLVASSSRQTALLVVPLIALWMAYDEGTRERLSVRARLLTAVGSAAIAVGVYLGSMRLADQFAPAGSNLEHVTGLLGWLRDSFDLRVAVKFLSLAVESPFLSVAVLAGAVTFRMREKVPTRIWILAAGAGCIWLQPFMAGPVLTGGNGQRLTTLALPPILLAVAIVLRDAGLFEHRRRPFWLCIGALALGSLHHAYVNQAFPIAGHHTINIVWFASACFLVLFVVLTELARHRREGLAPASQPG
jgi:hypothetical protein